MRAASRMFGWPFAASRTATERACRSAASTWVRDAATGAAAPGAPSAPASIAHVEAAERQARSAAVRDAAKTHPNIREATRILDGGVDKIEEL